MAKNYYLVDVKVRDGEHEYRQHCIVVANDLDSARSFAEANVDEEFGFGDKTTYSTVSGVHKITKNEVKTLTDLFMAFVIN